MKYIVTTIAALFATAAMAQTPAPKADAKPAAATTSPKAVAKPATTAASAPPKKDEKKAAEPAKK